MAWVEFKAAFDWTPPTDRRIEVAYSRGHVVNVTQDCAKAAVDAGKAVRIEAPSRLMAQAIAASGNRWPRRPPVEAAPQIVEQRPAPSKRRSRKGR